MQDFHFPAALLPGFEKPRVRHLLATKLTVLEQMYAVPVLSARAEMLKSGCFCHEYREKTVFRAVIFLSPQSSP